MNLFNKQKCIGLDLINKYLSSQPDSTLHTETLVQ